MRVPVCLSDMNAACNTVITILALCPLCELTLDWYTGRTLIPCQRTVARIGGNNPFFVEVTGGDQNTLSFANLCLFLRLCGPIGLSQSRTSAT